MQSHQSTKINVNKYLSEISVSFFFLFFFCSISDALQRFLLRHFYVFPLYMHIYIPYSHVCLCVCIYFIFFFDNNVDCDAAQGVDCSSALQQLAGELQEELKGVSSSTYVWVVSLFLLPA